MTVDTTPYFNIHDIALIVVVFQCALLTILLLAVRNRDALSSRMLALFLLAAGMVAADKLLYWCVPLKEAYFLEHPWIFFVFKSAVLLQGPLLYFYVRTTIYLNYPFRRYDLLHFIPFAVYPIYIFSLYHIMGSDEFSHAVSAYEIYLKYPFFRLLLIVQPVLIIGYCIAALRLLWAHSRGLKDQYSNLEDVDRNWLKILVLGFLLIWAWNLFVHFVAASVWPEIGPAVGLFANYLDFIFINCLVFYNLLHTRVMKSDHRLDDSSMEGLGSVLPSGSVGDDTENSSAVEYHFHAEDVRALEDTVKKYKLYLIADLTLDQLAARAGISPRVASQIINRHFNTCFFDFINSHRVAEAKILLVEHPDKTILDVSELAGFNSKSSFHRFFRRYADITPSEYRRIHGRKTTSANPS